MVTRVSEALPHRPSAWGAGPGRAPPYLRIMAMYMSCAVAPTRSTRSARYEKLLLARTPEAPHYWERRHISCFCFASHVGQLFRWAPGTRSALTGRRLAVSFPAGRDAVKARDALLGQCPLGQPRGVRRRGYSPTDTAHEMRIPLRPLRMSKPYRRLRKRSLRSD